MSTKEQRRAWVLSRVGAGEMGVTEAARPLGPTERSVRRLRTRMERQGPAGLVHGDRGRASPRRVSEATRARILELVETTYADVNDSHLAERAGFRSTRTGMRQTMPAFTSTETRSATRSCSGHNRRTSGIVRMKIPLTFVWTARPWSTRCGGWTSTFGFAACASSSCA